MSMNVCLVLFDIHESSCRMGKPWPPPHDTALPLYDLYHRAEGNVRRPPYVSLCRHGCRMAASCGRAGGISSCPIPRYGHIRSFRLLMSCARQMGLCAGTAAPAGFVNGLPGCPGKRGKVSFIPAFFSGTLPSLSPGLLHQIPIVRPAFS